MIDPSVLDQYREKFILEMDGSELLDEAVIRFLMSSLPEDRTWLVVQVTEQVYQALPMHALAQLLLRLGRDALFRPLADLPLPLAGRVVPADGALSAQEALAWVQAAPRRTLVVVDEDGFRALLANWDEPEAEEQPRLQEVYARINPPEEAAIGGHEEPDEEANGRPKGLHMANGGSSHRETATPPEETPAPLATEFRTNIQFPRQVQPGETQPLVVQLTRMTMPGAAADEGVRVEFADEFTPETVEVLVSAPGFSERSGVWIKSILVYSFADSAPAVFVLKAGDLEGEFPISVDFRHRGRLIGSARFHVMVTTQPEARAAATILSAGAADVAPARSASPGPEEAWEAPAGSAPGALLAISRNPPPPADVELRIRNDNNVLRFELHSPHSRVGYHYAPMGEKQLMDEPRAYMKAIFDDLSQWARTAVTDDAEDAAAQRTMDRIASVGNSLFLDLFPPELQMEYWTLKQLRESGVINTLYITSDEPWIPWELVKPFNERTGEADDFLAGGWRICRWLTGPGPADQVRVAAARLVAPDLDLDFVKQEVGYFQQLAQRGVDVGAPLRQLDEVRQVARHGGVELLHFSTHGNLSSQSIDRSAIVLEDDELLPQDLRGEVVRGLRRERPIVFINACHSARLGFSLTGLGGWAVHMIRDVRVSAFIGALWEVHDELAALFAQEFYNRLQAGEPLAEACYNARMHIRNLSPANSTWLAYTLYGDPNIRVAWGP